MRLSKTNRDHSLGVNMTPMIDIVFLLIIFFITVSQIARVTGYPLTLAQVAGASDELALGTVTINMDRDGKIFLSGEQYTMERTTRALVDLLDQKKGNPSQIRIEMRCDRLCPSGSVNRLIRELGDLGFGQVYITVAGEK